ncbi:MAG: hypothetical protein H6600_09410 [Flavobacteriales bacterium]|nr:hypothetical protein [Flavobacteriales bacterium]MCB9198666.1 hypothetical protein [Flavobacteriales bacterium]
MKKTTLKLIVICLFVSCTQERTNRILLIDNSESADQDSIADSTDFKEIVLDLNIEDNLFIYEFMNECIFKDTSNNIQDWTKLMPKTIPLNYDFNSLLKSMDTLLSSKEIEYMSWQLNSNKYEWNCENLVNVVCLDENRIESLFAFGTQIIETDQWTIYLDAWEHFRKEYGNGGIHSFSKPIFNEEHTIVIIEHYGQGDWTIGSGDIFIFQKLDNEWQLLKTINLWIS